MKTRILLAAGLCLGMPWMAPIGTPAATYNGVFFEDNGLWQQSAGYITILTTARRTYSGTLRLGANRHAFSGRLDAEGSGLSTVLRYRQFPLTLQFQVDPEDPDLIRGSLTDGEWTASMLADRAVFNGTTSVCPDWGRYTMIVPGDFLANDSPGGDSFGTITVSKAGLVQFFGSLADGRKCTQTTRVSKGGNWPLYVPLYQGQGALYGWMLFNGSDEEDLEGDVTWIRPEIPGAWYYPDGFAISVAAWGSRYIKPPPGQRILDLTTATIELIGGGLQRGITNQVALHPNHRVTNYSANGLRMTFWPTNGTFTGSIMDPISWDWISFRGVALQNSSVAAGYFLGWDQSGEVWMQRE